jgi:transposase-like protein
MFKNEDRPRFSFEAYRRLRFRRGVSCPHCGCEAVHRWGTFAGRQRYRCLGCPRTFSDFTGTSLAYRKRVDLWPEFCHCVLGSFTVRWTARRLGIHVSTAFRWRHHILDSLRAADRPVLSGEVELTEAIFPFSAKGSRQLDRPAHRRGDPFRWLGERVWVILGVDQEGRALAEVTGPRRPVVSHLVQVLLSRIAPGSVLYNQGGPLCAFALFARRAELGYHRRYGKGPGEPIIAEYRRSLHVWLEPFRGVATRYLPNYLTWHRFLRDVALTAVDREAAATRLVALACT